MTDAELVNRAREATHKLRDFARANGTDHFERDPLVMAIHRALDLADPVLQTTKEYAGESGCGAKVRVEG